MIMVTPSYCLNLIEELERQMGGDARLFAAYRRLWRRAVDSAMRRKLNAASVLPRWIFMACRK
jgi:hypothetical protein